MSNEMTGGSIPPKQKFFSWLLSCAATVAVCSAIPVGAVFLVRGVGGFYPDPEYDLFPTCMVLAIAAGVTLANKFGAFDRR
ncbi:hypothetical protein [Cupriavidus pauculus]|uniref:hypothetical protein n=1 Tax=Cupriavidus pauculus TaxID=82633 RepID=UPI0038578542